MARRLALGISIAALAAATPAGVASAATVVLNLTGSGSSGTVSITPDPSGPDLATLAVSGLQSNRTYTVFLSNGSAAGALPVQFLAEFTTDGSGAAQCSVRTELINAFASANGTLENEAGVAEFIGAGALSAGANTIPLDWISIYLADGSIYELGTGINLEAGPRVLVSSGPIP